MKPSTWLLLCLGLGTLGLSWALPSKNEAAARSRPQSEAGSKAPSPAKPTGKAASQQAVEMVSFNRDIRPILSENCFACHGPAAKEAKAGLRLDDFASATKERGGYRVITPGNPEKSSIFSRLVHADAGMLMPPPDSGKKVTPEQIEKLKQWIKQGAKYEIHWAFIAPKMPDVPAPKNAAWVKNDIDRFVLAELERRNLAPEAQTSKAQLLRRASLTLTGLQPTLSELNEFFNDKSPKAYENAVDRMLASPRYGEHQARFWLDAVRYGDTHGLHLDNERAIYPYRDWVIRAMNEDLPYDKFTLWQLAGDLLPNPTTQMKVATGYIRMNPTTSEGGAIEAEFLAKNTFDRVDTTSTVFLGLTVACARCHDHKYDPISHEDYFRMYAFFNSTKENPFDGNLLVPGPAIKAPHPSEERALKSRLAGLDKLSGQVEDAVALSWLKENTLVVPEFGKWEFSEAFKAENFDKAFETEFEVKKWTPGELAFNAIKQFVNAENAAGYARTTIKSKAAGEFPLRVGTDDAVKVFLNGVEIHSNKVFRGAEQQTDIVNLPLKEGDNALVIKVVNGGGPDGLKVGFGTNFQAKVQELSAKSGQPTFSKEAKELFLEFGPETPLSKRYKRELAEYRKLNDSIPFTLVAEELKEPRPSHILRRGEYDLPERRVTRGVPKVLGTLPKSAPSNRLGFAQWLTDDRHPLFSRVLVNRLWQQHFGHGLVKTPEDFGNQGEWPANPELLDYLAVAFKQQGYSVKKMHRLLVTSAAFRQSSKLSTQKRTVDPENRLVSRGPRFRLDAEVLRDQALNASGLLVLKSGGRGFRPYQPAGLWEEVAFLDSTTARYTMDTTSEIYRRTLYLFWKRTSPHPVMAAFDAPSREACVVKRTRTNTPLQALVTLNEPAFLETARMLGERLLKEPGTTEVRIQKAFKLALSRSPSAQESEVLSKAYLRYLAHYKAQQDDAKALIKVGIYPQNPNLDPAELASWTLVASTIFNLDEFLTQN